MDTQEIRVRVDWVLQWRRHSTVETQCVYYVLLNREAGKGKNSRTKRHDYYRQIIKEAGFVVYSWISRQM